MEAEDQERGIGGGDELAGPYALALAASVPPAAPLQHSLPSQLNQDPSGLMAMHTSFFGVGFAGTGAGAGTGGAGAAEPPGSQHHVWRRAAAPLTTKPSGAAALLGRRGDGQASPAPSPIGAGRGSPMLALPPTSGAVPAAAAGPGLGAGPYPGLATSACYVDAGLSLGPSFRVGWGPGGVLVYPGNLPGGNYIHTRRVLVEGPLPAGPAAAGNLNPPSEGSGPEAGEDGAAAMRRRLQRSLEVHLRMSSPEVPPLDLDGGMDEGGDAAGGLSGLAAGPGGDLEAIGASLPRWSLQCDRRGLGRLVDAFVQGPDAEGAQLVQLQQQQGGAAAAEPSQQELLLLLRHEGEAWRLVQALWEYVEGEEDDGGEEARGGPSDAAAAGMGDDDGGGSMEEGGFAGAGALAGFVRRRLVSQWLRRQAKALAEPELAGVSEPCEAVLRLLSAQQPAAAAAVAAACGDVRLATLLAGSGGAGARAEARGDAERQLDVWRRSDMLGSISRERLLIYRLLAGQVRVLA
jgi:hypothetical protein